jgi:enoyl-CoA hydratase/carnithine racemase
VTEGAAEAELVVERRDAVVVARLNRPDARNALTPTIMTGLADLVADAEANPDIRAIVITGTGDKAFCAGMDLKAFSAGTNMALDPEVTRQFFRILEGEVAVPVIGAANASAVGGGFEILLGCDLIIASSSAKFGLPEVKRGLMPGGSGMWLGTRIPLNVALEIGLTGDSIDAARAYELGLVNAVAPPETVLDVALEYAQRIAGNGPLGVRAVKELVRLGVANAARAVERRAEWQPVVFESEDAKEGARAFMEKRAPVWQGR